MPRYSVWLKSWPAAAEPRLVRRLVRLFDRPEERIRHYLRKRPVRLARDLDEERVRKLRAYLLAAGVELEIESSGDSLNAGMGESSSMLDNPSEETASSLVMGSTTQVMSSELQERMLARGAQRRLRPELGLPVSAVRERDLDDPDQPRPLGLGERLRLGLALASRNLWGLWLAHVALTVVVALVVGSILLGVSGASLDAIGSGQAGEVLMSAGGSVVALAGFVAILLVGGFSAAASVAMFLQAPGLALMSGRRAGPAMLIAAGVRRLPVVFTAIVIVGLPIWLIDAAALAGVGVIGAGLGRLILFGVTLGLTAIWGLVAALVLPVASLERIGPFAAFRRGLRLGTGRRFSLLLALVVWTSVAGTLAYGLGLALGWLGQTVGGASGATAALVVVVASLVIWSVFVTFTLAVYGFLLVSFYFEARIIDQQWHPGWLETLHPTWPLAAVPDPPAGAAGPTDWMLALGAVAVLIAVLAGVTLLAGLAGLAILPAT